MTPKKKLLYKVFVLLQTHVHQSHDKSTKTYVVSIKDRISTELRWDVFEGATKETPNTSADEMLATLSATHQESIDKESAVHPVEELTPEDATLVERDDEPEASEE